MSAYLPLVFGLVGGLGLFLYGMQLMADGLQKIAGDRLRRLLEVLTSTPLIGVLVGTGVTMLIQSSSATTVMVVGFVNAGLLSLKQAISLIMGANIGTTVTAFMVSLKLTDLALPAIGIGFLITLVGKKKSTRFLGQTVLGFGLLFLGMKVMGDAMQAHAQNGTEHLFYTPYSQPQPETSTGHANRGRLYSYHSKQQRNDWSCGYTG